MGQSACGVRGDGFGGVSGAIYEKGKVITGIDQAEQLKDVVVFHAGTSDEGWLVW